MSEDGVDLPDEDRTVEKAMAGNDVSEINEEMPVLDVHVPHPTHTWKDFFIHVGTICVGLLIAVSLEQTVEYFHRAHERHLLVEELRDEVAYNQRNAESSITALDARLKFLLRLSKDVDTMLASGGRRDLPIRVLTYPTGIYGLPHGPLLLQMPIWESAKNDGRIALLPETAKREFGLLSFRCESGKSEGEALRLATLRRNAYLLPFANIRTPNRLVFSRMSQSQIVEYRSLIADEFQNARALRNVYIQIFADFGLVLKEENIPLMDLLRLELEVEAESVKAHPEDFVKMADEIDAEDAARDQAAVTPGKTTK
jgi:hypothetical protein